MQPSPAAGLDRVIAVANGKGGTYKTSVTSAVGGLAAAGGWSVLLVDLDPQGNITEDLGLTGETDEGTQQVEAVTLGRPLTPHPTHRQGLSVVYGGHHLHDLQSVILGRQSRDPAWAHALADALAPIVDQYDLVLIDCPPGSETLQTLALVAARHVLIPTKSDAGSRKGLREIARRFLTVRPLNPELDLLGVVLTGTSSNATRIRAEVRAEIETDLGGVAPVLDATIRHAEAPAREGRNRGQLPHELEVAVDDQAPFWRRLRGERTERELPKTAHGLAQDYAALTQEILDLLAAEESTTSTG